MRATKTIYQPKVNRQNKVLAALLVVVFLYSLVPLEWVHSYSHTDDICVDNDACQKATPCHVSLYHQHTPVERCEHNSHYAEQHESCSFCYLLSHHPQQHYTQPTPYTTGSIEASNLLTKDYSKNYTPVFSPSQTNKGPPVV